VFGTYDFYEKNRDFGSILVIFTIGGNSSRRQNILISKKELLSTFKNINQQRIFNFLFTLIFTRYYDYDQLL
jgi:hypothetical protein